MNKAALKKNVGKKIRIRPIPIRKLSNGISEEIDDLWIIEGVSDNSITISNICRGGYLKTIGLDHYKEYKTDAYIGSDGFLIFRSQIVIDGKRIVLEPL